MRYQAIVHEFILMELDKDNACDVLVLGDQTNDAELKKEALRTITMNHAHYLVTKIFYTCSQRQIDRKSRRPTSTSK